MLEMLSEVLIIMFASVCFYAAQRSDGMRSDDMLSALQGYCREAQLYCAAEGKPGPPGNSGDKGEVGNPGLPGAIGGKGQKGSAPDALLVAQNLGSMDHMRGPAGPPGEQGEKGSLGVRGNMGPPGPDGRAGLDGEKGDKGDTGDRGDKGMRGLIGFPGIKGEPGPQGPLGERGYNGANGEDGKRGRRGEGGPPGSPGPRGTAGVPGVPGLKGYKGDSGQNGPIGQKGERGDNGRCPAYCVDPQRKPRTTTITTTPVPTTVTTTTTPTTTTTTPTTTTTTPVPTLSPRETTCSITRVGKPYYLRKFKHHFRGAWMRDAAPPADVSPQLQWTAPGIRGELLYQFASQQALKGNITNDVYDLKIPYAGTGHVVYNHSLYYQAANSWRIYRYDLKLRQVVSASYLHHKDAQFTGDERLYKDLPGAVDFAVDETGLWVIYANHKDDRGGRREMGGGRRAEFSWEDEDVFFLAKLDPKYMEKLKVFRLKVPMNFRGNAFMTCGTLYLVRHSDRQRTSIAWAYDAYREREATPKIAFSNPYGNTSQLLYDPKLRHILAWDSNVLVWYPLLRSDDPL